MMLEADAVAEHHLHVEIFEIVKQDHVRPIPGGDGPVALEPVGLGGVDGGHLHSLYGVDAVGHGPAEDVVDVALPLDVSQVLVVGAEEHPAGGELVLGDVPHDLLHAPAGGPQPQVEPHAPAQLLQEFAVFRAFVVRLGPGDTVGVELVPEEQGGVAVDGPALEELEFIQHLPVAGDHGHVIHHFPQADDPFLGQEGLHIAGHQLGAAGLEAGAGDAGGDHEEHGQRQPFRLIQHVLDAVGAAGVGDLMGIGDNGGGALLEHAFGEPGRMGHGGFDMHMAVDEAGAEECAVSVDLLPAGIVSDAEDDAIPNGHVPVLDGAGEHVDDIGVLDDKGGVF